jgi:hypothetical protein
VEYSCERKHYPQEALVTEQPNGRVGRYRKVVIEHAIWLSFACIVFVRPYLVLRHGNAYSSRDLEFFFYENLYPIVFGFIILLFPSLFQMVFGRLPFELLSDRIRKMDAEPVLKRGELETSETASVVDKPEHRLSLFARTSGKLAERLFNRGGVYLLVGVIIALVGVTFFFFQTLSITQAIHPLTASAAPTGPNLQSINIADILLLLGSRLGILFFIEFVAFFFLRQYRATMDEFRYYEAIKRSREDNLIILLLAKESWGDLDFYRLMSLCSFNAAVGKLTKDETTDILESRKLAKDEIIVFEKLTEAANKILSRKNENAKT